MMAQTLCLGIDIVDRERIRRLIDNYSYEELLSVFAQEELSTAPHERPPELRLSICFGVKEAVGKALGCGLEGFSLPDVVTQVCGNGQANLSFRGDSKSLVIAREWIWHISYTLTLGYVHVIAIGSVLASGLGHPHGSPPESL